MNDWLIHISNLQVDLNVRTLISILKGCPNEIRH